MTENIFVVGLTSFHREQLEEMLDDHLTFHPLLPLARLQPPRDSFDDVVAEAEAELDAFEGPIDAIIGYWDFPVTTLVPILQRRHGVPGPDLWTVVACEHKYWSRLRQAEAAPDVVPDFAAFDPFEDDPWEIIGLEPPYWVKPVISYSSHLAFRIGDRDDLDRAVGALREGIHGIAEPFADVFGRIDLPDDVRGIDGYHCIAERDIRGDQLTVEGHIREGRGHVHAVVDSLYEGSYPSFSRYRYPSALPDGIQSEASRVATDVLTHIGYDDGAFNVEFSVRDGEIHLLEINARISQSHAPLTHLVDGAPNYRVPIDLALGREPRLPRGQGPYGVAAKYHLRHDEDGVVGRIPTETELVAIEETFPGTRIQIDVREGQRLSELTDQDAYTYELGSVYLGAEDEDALQHRYEEIVARLELRIRE